MNEVWMFVGTLVFGVGYLMFIGPLIRALDEPVLRAGLWINGVDGKRADDVVKFHKTGKLPE